VICGYDWDSERYYILDEYKRSEATTEQHAIEIRKLLDKWGCEMTFIDAAAQQTKFDFAQNYDISTNNAKKSVLDGIAAVGVLCEQRRLWVHEDCEEVLKSLDQYKWDPNAALMKEKPVHNDASHMADALRYAIYSFEVSGSTF
jgi:phage terminase large subunit